MRILIAEDERVVAASIAEWLRMRAHAVDIVGDGNSALERVAVNEYDVLILDRDLPGVGGDEVCRQVATSGAAVRILMLTASGGLEDRVAGLAMGADDYLPKPFAFTELGARVEALGRRARPPTPPVLERSGIRIDVHRLEVVRDGRYVPLSRKEFAVLRELLVAEGAYVSAEMLLEKVWDEHVDPFTGVVRVTILKLRRKLGDPPIVETAPGVGYRVR